MTPADLAELVRLPAVLSVPGDALVGAAAGAAPGGGRLGAAAGLLYLGGMALNDYADRTVDALERPARPVPSGRVPAATARRTAVALTTGGLAGAGALGGRRALRLAVPLAATVWAYDTRAKDTRAAAPAMVACRVLDVALGASGGSVARALPAAAVVGAHTAAVMSVSAHETTGGDPAVPRRAAAATTAVAAGTVALALAGPGRRLLPAHRTSRRAAARDAAAVGATAWAALRYARAAAPGLRAAAADPTPEALQEAVGRAVMALPPLQTALLAAHGALPQAAGLHAALAGARALLRRRAPARPVS